MKLVIDPKVRVIFARTKTRSQANNIRLAYSHVLVIPMTDDAQTWVKHFMRRNNNEISVPNIGDGFFAYDFYPNVFDKRFDTLLFEAKKKYGKDAVVDMGIGYSEG